MASSIGKSDGKDHTVRLSFPSDTYVPVFSRRTAKAAPVSTQDSLQEQCAFAHDPEDARTGITRTDSGKDVLIPFKQRRWIYSLLAAGLVLILFGVYLA